MIQNNTISEALKYFYFEDGQPQARISGKSMLPFFLDKQRIKIQPLTMPPRHGRCYVFFYKNSLRIHRLTGITKGTARFIGDNCLYGEKVHVSNIIGEVDDNFNSLLRGIVKVINAAFSGCSYYPARRFRRKLLHIIGALFHEKKV